MPLRDYTRAMARPRYRVRAWLRGNLPASLSVLFPKGARDCGRHDWYRADDRTEACYHCRVGRRSHASAPDRAHRSVRPAGGQRPVGLR